MTATFEVTPLGMSAAKLLRARDAFQQDICQMKEHVSSLNTLESAITEYDALLLIDSATRPRYSLAFIEAQETSEARPGDLVVIRHPQNGDIAFHGGRVLPDNPFDRMDADAALPVEVTPLGYATVAFNRAQEDLIDCAADLQEGGRPDFGPANARMSIAIEALQECGVDPFEEACRLAEEAQDEANAYWEQQAQQAQEEYEPSPYDGTFSED